MHLVYDVSHNIAKVRPPSNLSLPRAGRSPSPLRPPFFLAAGGGAHGGGPAAQAAGAQEGRHPRVPTPPPPHPRRLPGASSQAARQPGVHHPMQSTPPRRSSRDSPSSSAARWAPAPTCSPARRAAWRRRLAARATGLAGHRAAPSPGARPCSLLRRLRALPQRPCTLLLTPPLTPRLSPRRSLAYEDVLQALEAKGISIRVASPKLVMEEAPESYKDVNQVVDTCAWQGTWWRGAGACLTHGPLGECAPCPARRSRGRHLQEGGQAAPHCCSEGVRGRNQLALWATL